MTHDWRNQKRAWSKNQRAWAKKQSQKLRDDRTDQVTSQEDGS